MVRSIGADHVIDYTKEDYTESELTYDVIYETVGKSSFSRSMGALKEEGIYIAGRPSMSQIAKMAWTSMTTSKKMIFGAAEEPPEDLLFIKDLIEAGKLKPVIDRTYPLEQIVEAHRYADTGHKKGNVVITVANNDNA
jgi:NADPH:quinone reductase-like Zn-dependent oxidoreductase